MAYLYFIAFLPVLIGFAIWLKNRRVIWQEWIIGCICSFLLAAIMHICAVVSIGYDVETLSGRVIKAVQYSAWQEYYEEAIYKTEYYTTTEHYRDSNGKSRSRSVRKSRRVFSHWESRRRWHPEYFEVYSDIPSTHRIDKQEFERVVGLFSNKISVAGTRQTGEHNSRMISGDPNDYQSKPVSGYIYPVTATASFENRIKSAPSVYSFAKVPTNIVVYEWPNNPDFKISNRLIGDARSKISILKWDQLNAVIGPKKQVNIIMVGFINQPSSIADYQQAKWIGGKKNDLVLCYGTNGKTIEWSRVFSWSEREDCKRNLETILLDNPINDDIIPLIYKEVLMNFERKDWHKFDYISIDPPKWLYPTFLILLLISQTVLYIFFHRNDIDRSSVRNLFNKY